MRRMLLLVTMLLALGAPLAVPMGAQALTVRTANVQYAAIHGPQGNCPGVPYPC